MSKFSDCCGAMVVLDDICHKCKEHCDPIIVDDEPCNDVIYGYDDGEAI